MTEIAAVGFDQCFMRAQWWMQVIKHMLIGIGGKPSAANIRLTSVSICING